MFKLSDDDSRAVDMFLDQGRWEDGGFTAAPAPFRQRLENVGAILNLLNEFSAADPPNNLVARTMAAVDQGPRHRVTPMIGGDRASASNRPHA
jgi:hypothetical protein